MDQYNALLPEVTKQRLISTIHAEAYQRMQLKLHLKNIYTLERPRISEILSEERRRTDLENEQQMQLQQLRTEYNTAQSLVKASEAKRSAKLHRLAQEKALTDCVHLEAANRDTLKKNALTGFRKATYGLESQIRQTIATEEKLQYTLFFKKTTLAHYDQNIKNCIAAYVQCFNRHKDNIDNIKSFLTTIELINNKDVDTLIFLFELALEMSKALENEATRYMPTVFLARYVMHIHAKLPAFLTSLNVAIATIKRSGLRRITIPKESSLTAFFVTPLTEYYTALKSISDSFSCPIFKNSLGTGDSLLNDFLCFACDALTKILTIKIRINDVEAHPVLANHYLLKINEIQHAFEEATKFLAILARKKHINESPLLEDNAIRCDEFREKFRVIKEALLKFRFFTANDSTELCHNLNAFDAKLNPTCGASKRR